MKRGLCFIVYLAPAFTSHALEPGTCGVVHDRAHSYNADGQRRLWQVGTHHEFHPDSTSLARFDAWLEAGVPAKDKNGPFAAPASLLNMFGDFLVCPTEPFRKGAVQEAVIKSVQHRHCVPIAEVP